MWERAKGGPMSESGMGGRVSRASLTRAFVSVEIDTMKQQAASSKQQAASSKQQAASGKRQAASGKRQAASGKRQAASGKRQAASGKRQAASGKRQAASGKRQAASGKRQAASGKRQAASGKRQAASGAATPSGAPGAHAPSSSCLQFPRAARALHTLPHRDRRALCARPDRGALQTTPPGNRRPLPMRIGAPIGVPARRGS